MYHRGVALQVLLVESPLQVGSIPWFCNSSSVAFIDVNAYSFLAMTVHLVYLLAVTVHLPCWRTLLSAVSLSFESIKLSWPSVELTFSYVTILRFGIQPFCVSLYVTQHTSVVVVPSVQQIALARKQAHVDRDKLIQALLASGITHVRLVSFGMKMPLASFVSQILPHFVRTTERNC